MSVKFNAEEKPFRVRIVGTNHPHAGAEGICFSQKVVQPTTTLMAEVRFDHPRAGVDACFAAESELERIDAT